MSDRPSTLDEYRTPRVPVVGILVLVVLSFVTVIGIVIAFDTETEPFIPPGYYGEAILLSEAAAADLRTIASAAVLERCLNGDGDSCTEQAGNARSAADRVAALKTDLQALSPPSRAAAWHARYAAALAELGAALAAQTDAIDVRDAQAFNAAVDRTRAAAAAEIALNDEFNIAFTDIFRSDD